MDLRDDQRELLSAGFDGELSNDERAPAEALQTAAAGQRLLDEMQQIRQEMGALPRHKLDRGFAERVIASIEQRREASTARRHHLRTALTAVLVLAVVLLLMFLISGPSGSGNSRSGTRTAREQPGPGAPEKPRPGSELAKKRQDRLPFVDEAIKNKYLFIFEVRVTPTGVQRKAFDACLKRCGLQYDPSLQLDRSLEELLLESRFLKGIEARQADAAPRKKGEAEVQLVYAVARGNHVDDAWKTLRLNAKDFADVKLNMAMMPADFQVFAELRKAIELKLAASTRDLDPVERLTAQVGKARRLVLNLALFSPAFRKVATQSLVRSDPGRASDVASDPRISEKKRTAGGWDARLYGPDAVFEILFIIHNQNQLGD